MEPACQDHSCTLNTLKSSPKIAGFITVYLLAICRVLSTTVYLSFLKPLKENALINGFESYINPHKVASIRLDLISTVCT